MRKRTHMPSDERAALMNTIKHLDDNELLAMHNVAPLSGLAHAIRGVLRQRLQKQQGVGDKPPYPDLNAVYYIALNAVITAEKE